MDEVVYSVALWYLGAILFTLLVAYEKGYNPWLWGGLALVFHVLALIAIAGMPVLNIDDEANLRAMYARIAELEQLPQEATAWDPRAGDPRA
ncbi:MAG TPA: hypothetical protein VM600_01870 [Actinomycetota bacterium]|nr:hypothetical protein [Actinomycetota bacterium]